MIDTKPLPNTRLAELIGKAIDSSNLKDKEVAELTGVTPQAVYGWRTTGRIRKGTLKKLAQATNTQLGYFLDDASDEVNDSPVDKSHISPSLTSTTEVLVNPNDINEMISSFFAADRDGRAQILSMVRAVARKTAITAATSAASDQR